MRSGNTMLQALLCFVLVLGLITPAAVVGAATTTLQATDEHLITSSAVYSLADSIIYVPDDHPTIQSAVNAAVTGSIIIVRDGTYKENVVIDKSVIVKSQYGARSTIVEAEDPNDNVFRITADHVTLSGLTVKGATAIASEGVRLSRVDFCTVSQCIISDNYRGVMLDRSSYNTLADNIISENNDVGIALYQSSGNSITDNTVSSNGFYGISVWHSNGNSVYLNNFADNDVASWTSHDSTNAWSSTEGMTYIHEEETHTGRLGNYWSDYAGSDTNRDGIGDSPYRMGVDNDHYPLVEPLENYGYGVKTMRITRERGSVWTVRMFLPPNAEITGVEVIEGTDNLVHYGNNYLRCLNIGYVSFDNNEKVTFDVTYWPASGLGPTITSDELVDDVITKAKSGVFESGYPSPPFYNVDRVSEWMAYPTYDVDKSPRVTLPQGDYEWVAIVPQDWTDAIQPLIDWREQMGVPSYTATTEWIYSFYNGEDNPWKLREFIKDAFNVWRIEYVVIVGDTDVIPSRYIYRTTLPYAGDYVVTDAYYSNLDGTWDIDGNGVYGEDLGGVFNEGEWLPEVIVGRLPVNNLEELTGVVDKILAYEQQPPVVTQKFLGIVGWFDNLKQNWYPVKLAESIPSQLEQTWLVYGGKLASGDFGEELVSKEQVRDRLNEGQNIVLLDAHGWHSSWYLGPDVEGVRFHASDAAYLENGLKLPIVFAQSCFTAKFDEGNQCIGVNMVKNPNGGAIVYIGDTTYGSMVYDLLGFFFADLDAETDRLETGRAFFQNAGYFGLWGYTTLALLGDPATRVWVGSPPNSPPYPPSDPMPADDAPVVAPWQDLSWTGGDPDFGDTLTYDVYFGTHESPPFRETIGPYPAAQSSITYDPGTLAPDTTYYWRIVARDDHGAVTEGPVWSFTTGHIDLTPYFFADKLEVKVGETVIFANETTGGVTPYVRAQWDFDGDGIMDEDLVGTHAEVMASVQWDYDAPGTYNVALTMTDSQDITRIETRWYYITVDDDNDEPENDFVDNPPVEEGLASISGELIIVLLWQPATQTWDLYFPLTGDDTIGTLEAGRAYWIYVDADCTLEYGTRTIELYAGWNNIAWLPQ